MIHVNFVSITKWNQVKINTSRISEIKMHLEIFSVCEREILPVMIFYCLIMYLQFNISFLEHIFLQVIEAQTEFVNDKK